MADHSAQQAENGIHTIRAFYAANDAARTGGTWFRDAGLTDAVSPAATDVGKVLFQIDTGNFYLISTAPTLGFVNLSASATTILPWDGKAIGEPFPLRTDLTGVSLPPISNFVLLSANQDGVGQFNENKVTNQQTTGTAPNQVVTFDIDDLGSPLNGETVECINTMGAFVKPGETGGTFEQDEFQGHSHEVFISQSASAGINQFVLRNEAVGGVVNQGWSDDGVGSIQNPTTCANGAPRFGNETRPRNVSAVYYMRIR